MMRALRLPLAVRQAIIQHARREAPQECCGFLLGRGRSVTVSYAARNVSPTPRTRFRVHPREHIDVRRVLRNVVPPLLILGVYHSHPEGSGRPSPSDIAQAFVSEWAFVVVDLSAPARARLTAWTIRNGRARRMRLER